MLGHHVYDHKFQELSTDDLERAINPSGEMNTMLRRGNLWKTVPACFWRVEDSVHGCMPSQPGLDLDLQSMCLHTLLLQSDL
jgi:hypothetical protein